MLKETKSTLAIFFAYFPDTMPNEQSIGKDL